MVDLNLLDLAGAVAQGDFGNKVDKRLYARTSATGGDCFEEFAHGEQQDDNRSFFGGADRQRTKSSDGHQKFDAERRSRYNARVGSTCEG